MGAKIHERCICGAEFDWDGGWLTHPSHGAGLLVGWRMDHEPCRIAARFPSTRVVETDEDQPPVLT